jgi:hypothetical protein
MEFYREYKAYREAATPIISKLHKTAGPLLNQISHDPASPTNQYSMSEGTSPTIANASSPTSPDTTQPLPQDLQASTESPSSSSPSTLNADTDTNTGASEPTNNDFPEYAQLKEQICGILDTYFTPGTQKELNVPDKIRKKLVKDVKELGLLHPDVFLDAVDNVCTMMRLSSFPNFYRAAQASLAAPTAKTKA